MKAWDKFNKYKIRDRAGIDGSGKKKSKAMTDGSDLFNGQGVSFFQQGIDF